MATRLDKIMEPILKEKCDGAFLAGYRKGVEDGWKTKNRAYENELESLKFTLNRLRPRTCPTVDAVEVVRCKDCKHMEMTPDCLRWCNVWSGINGMGDEGFCNYGERRTDNG